LSEVPDVRDVIPSLKVGEVMTVFSVRSTQTRSIYMDSPVKTREPYKPTESYIDRVDSYK
jgi:hypothetical protein